MNILIKFFNDTYNWIDEDIDKINKQLQEKGDSTDIFLWKTSLNIIKFSFCINLVLVTIQNILLFLMIVESIKYNL